MCSDFLVRSHLLKRVETFFFKRRKRWGEISISKSWVWEGVRRAEEENIRRAEEENIRRVEEGEGVWNFYDSTSRYKWTSWNHLRLVSKNTADFKWRVLIYHPSLGALCVCLQVSASFHLDMKSVVKCWSLRLGHHTSYMNATSCLSFSGLLRRGISLTRSLVPFSSPQFMSRILK